MRLFSDRLWILFALLPAIFASHAEDPLPNVTRLQSSPMLRHLKKNPMTAAPTTPAEQTVSQFYVPEGFRVDLVLSEPDLHQPIAFTFDERGRIWVAEAYSYPTKRPPGEGQDKIVIFEDKDGDGKFETRKVFAEKLNLVSGFEVGYGGVWIGAAPELLFIPDKNHDDIPDSATASATRTRTSASTVFFGAPTDGFTASKASLISRTSASRALPMRNAPNFAPVSGVIIRSAMNLKCSRMAAAIRGASITTNTASFS
jgi:hypothetical protein